MITAGGIVLLGVGVLLWQATRDTDAVEAAGTKPMTPEKVERAPEPVQAPGPGTRCAKIAPPAAVPTRTTQQRPTAAPGAAPALAEAGSGSDDEPASRKEMKYQLKKQVDAIDAYVSECVAKAQKAGLKLTGAAALRVWASRVKGKTVITNVAVEPIDTTITDPATLDCLRETGRKMVLDLPEDATTLMATHQVDLQDGGMTDHRLTYLELDPPVTP